MADKRGKTPEQLDKELEDDLADILREIDAAGDEAWTKEDQAWFDSLPEGLPLPETPGSTLVTFFKRSPRPVRPKRRRSRKKGGSKNV